MLFSKQINFLTVLYQLYCIRTEYQLYKYCIRTEKPSFKYLKSAKNHHFFFNNEYNIFHWLMNFCQILSCAWVVAEFIINYLESKKRFKHFATSIKFSNYFFLPYILHWNSIGLRDILWDFFFVWGFIPQTCIQPLIK